MTECAWRIYKRGEGGAECNDRIFCAGRICKSGEGGGQNAMTECAGANLQEWWGGTYYNDRVLCARANLQRWEGVIRRYVKMTTHYCVVDDVQITMYVVTRKQFLYSLQKFWSKNGRTSWRNVSLLLVAGEGGFHENMIIYGQHHINHPSLKGQEKE